MTELHVAKQCDRNHGYGGQQDEEEEPVARVTSEKLDKIVDRLYNNHTASSRGEAGQPVTARDTISRKMARGEATLISDRLYKTHTKAMQDHPDEQMKAEDRISKGRLNEQDLERITERMYSSHTTASKGGGPQPIICDNAVSSGVEGDLEEIFKRLQTTHTKSSSGGQECRPWEGIKTPGLGLKMLPPIDGIETRFIGHQKRSTDQLKDLDQRMMRTQTASSQARLDPPRILLYPERTTLCNNPDRIRTYQNTGSTASQGALERREKWFN